MKTFAMFLLVASTLAAAGPVVNDVKWETSLPAAQERARKEGKPIFVDVWTDWCGWCTQLKTKTFPSPEAKAALAGVVPLSLRTQDLKGNSTDTYDVQNKYGVNVYPTLLMLNADGTERGRNQGFLPPERFAAWVHATAGR
jgi:thiol:disulfide interchange protein